MNSERAQLLAELLDEMACEPEGYFPEEAFASIQRAFAIPYVDLIIPQMRLDGTAEILLTWRQDKHFTGWHLPGGIWRVKDSREAACEKVAQRELGVGVTFTQEIMTDKWDDHPYGHPIAHISLLCP